MSPPGRPKGEPCPPGGAARSAVRGGPTSGGAADAGHADFRLAALLPVVVLTIVWGCNWPVLKLGVADVPPLTFRLLTLPFAAIGMLAVARLTGHSLAVPRALWGKVACLALVNITGWNALLLFGVRDLPAGRSAILAYTMPVWSALFALLLLHERVSPRKLAGMALGVVGMALLLGDDIRHFQRTPGAALLILGASMSWALGTVLLRRWKLPLPQTTLTGWMMLVGAVPIAVLEPFFSSGPLPPLSERAIFAILYNIFLAGMLAHLAWFTLARTLPVAVSSMSSLPVPVVGVFAGMLALGERPGAAEWAALAFVVAAMLLVLWPARRAGAQRAPDG